MTSYVPSFTYSPGDLVRAVLTGQGPRTLVCVARSPQSFVVVHAPGSYHRMLTVFHHADLRAI